MNVLSFRIAIEALIRSLKLWGKILVDNPTAIPSVPWASNKGNLIGRIVEVNYTSSRILLLNDLNSRIPVVISPNGSQAILSGSGESMPNLQYLPENFKIGENNLVFTSGKDGIFFSGISVGQAVSDAGTFKVKLFSDPNQINFVNVVLDKYSDLKGF